MTEKDEVVVLGDQSGGSINLEVQPGDQPGVKRNWDAVHFK
jgi:hypothetical protein